MRDGARNLESRIGEYMAARKKARPPKNPLTPEQTVAKELTEAILKGLYNPTQEDLIVSKAIQMLRGRELRLHRDIEAEIFQLAQKHLEIFLRNVLEDLAVSNGLRVMDITTIIEIMAANLRTLPLWESNHIELIDDILINSGLCDEEEEELEEEKRDTKTEAICAALGASYIGDDCDCGD